LPSSTSLQVRLLRRLLLPLAAILAVGAIASYYFSVEPAMDAFDHALINNGVAVGDRIRMEGAGFVDLPSRPAGVAHRPVRPDYRCSARVGTRRWQHDCRAPHPRNPRTA
jgi:hypothetical protein